METDRSRYSAAGTSARTPGHSSSLAMGDAHHIGSGLTPYVPSQAPSLSVQVLVRDVTLTLELGAGSQTCKWVALTCAALYAAQHAHLQTVGGVGSATAFTPVHLTDARGQLLFPAEIIGEKVETGDVLRLDLLGPKLGLAQTAEYKRERSLWELYAYHAADVAQLVPIVFLFDATNLALTQPPALFGNFNAWALPPIPMQHWKGNMYMHLTFFPPGAEIVFKFILGGSEAVLQPQTYPIVHDSFGNKLHHIRVAPIPSQPSLDCLGILTSPLDGVLGNGSTSGANAQAALAQAAIGLPATALQQENGNNGAKAKKVFTLREIIAMNQRAQAAYLAQERLARNTSSELPVLSQRIVGTYPTFRLTPMTTMRMEPRAAERLAQRDWHELSQAIGDIYPAMTFAPSAKPAAGSAAAAAASLAGSPSHRSSLATTTATPTKLYSVRMAELRQVVLKYHAELTSIFRYYALGCSGPTACLGAAPGASGAGAWNILKFLTFLALIKVPDATTSSGFGGIGGGRATMQRLDRIYYQVIRKAQKSPADLANGSKSLTSPPGPTFQLGAHSRVVQHAHDAFRACNLMTRAQFVEALVRVAMLKYKNPTRLEDYASAHPTFEEKKATAPNDGTVPVPAVGPPKDKHAHPTSPLPSSSEPNPGLSFELLVKHHILPFTLAQAREGPQGAYAQAHYASAARGHGSRKSATATALSNPNELRTRLIADASVFTILEKYSPDLMRLFHHYAEGSSERAGGLGGLSGSSSMASGFGGSTGGAFSRIGSGGALTSRASAGGALAQAANGSISSSLSAGTVPVSSSSIGLRELESLLVDYELLDSSVPRGRALANLSPNLAVLDGEEVGADGTAAGGAEGTGGLGAHLELLYPEWLEMLVRIADTGLQWSNLYAEQQRLIAQAIAAGTLNPLDKPPASMLIATHPQPAAGDDDHDDETGASASSRRIDDTDLCERFLRLCHWLFPSEAESRERRAKLAQQQQQQQQQQLAQAAPPPKKEETKEEEKAPTATPAKGKKVAMKPSPSPAKKMPAKK